MSTKSKPRIHPDGSWEWVPMSAVVLVHDANSASELVTCIALATGCKCLPHSTLPRCHGEVLHDNHAEILALRGLNRFLLVEASRLLDPHTTGESDFLYPCSSHAIVKPDDVDKKSPGRGDGPPFAIRPNVSIHMFSTEAPCGDASMEILMSELGPDASVSWKAPQASTLLSSECSASAVSLQGRGFFSDLGTVRRKPSRADAKPTLSKSCTDKLSVKQITSLLSFPTYHFIETSPNVYLSSLILPAAKYSAAACTRAFSRRGRLSPMQDLNLSLGYNFHPFRIVALPIDFRPQFPFSKPPVSQVPRSKPPPPGTSNEVKPNPKPRVKASNISALCIHRQSSCQNNNNTTPGPQFSINETLVNGVNQGYSLRSPDPRKASRVSRVRMLELGQNIASKLVPGNTTRAHMIIDVDIGFTAGLQGLLEAKTYAEAKATTQGTTRRKVKEMVASLFPGCPGGADGAAWPRNDGDDEWG